jgi:hypothetical protein
MVRSQAMWLEGAVDRKPHQFTVQRPEFALHGGRKS